MTIKPRARKFRIRRGTPLSVGIPSSAGTMPAPEPTASNAGPTAESTAEQHLLAQRGEETTAPSAPAPDPNLPSQKIDALRHEGLTGRQLRMARRVAQKHGLAVTSDFDAVRQLRDRGIDPFQRSNILDLVTPPEQSLKTNETAMQLPQTTTKNLDNLPAIDRMSPAERRAIEIAKIQKDMAKRRRRKSLQLLTRLSMFVFLPTLLTGWYFYFIATPMFATNSEFVIQQAEAQGGVGGLGGLFAGTSAATQQDSTTVQSYLTSRSALRRLDAEFGFKSHFSGPEIDALQRMPDDATNEAAFKVYSDKVRISYDPTEGIIRMEVIAADPETSQRFSEALIVYAEEQVDHLTQRLREDQMAGALASYDAAEQRRSDALARLLDIQQQVQLIDPVGETTARIQQISALETQRQQLQLTLQSRLDVTSPNQAQVNALRSQIQGVDTLIAQLRFEMTQSSDGSTSLASNNTALRRAEEDYAFQIVLVQQALQQMESARIEANRQVRYLSLGVEPIAPDEATYPRAFENTALAFLVFAGIYLMISLTASILREQISS